MSTFTHPFSLSATSLLFLHADYVLFEGTTFVFKLALALLQEEEANLLKLNSFEHVLSYIQTRVPVNCAQRAEVMLQRAAAVDLPAPYLERLTNEFEALQMADRAGRKGRNQEAAAAASSAAASSAAASAALEAAGNVGATAAAADGKRQRASASLLPRRSSSGPVTDRNHVLALLADTSHMPTAVARLQLALLDREAQVQELERENFSCRQQVNHAKSALQTLCGEVEAAEAEAAAAQARCSELEQENAQLRRALSAAGVSASSAQAGPGTTSSV